MLLHCRGSDDFLDSTSCFSSATVSTEYKDVDQQAEKENSSSYEKSQVSSVGHHRTAESQPVLALCTAGD